MDIVESRKRKRVPENCAGTSVGEERPLVKKTVLFFISHVPWKGIVDLREIRSISIKTVREALKTQSPDLPLP